MGTLGQIVDGPVRVGQSRPRKPIDPRAVEAARPNLHLSPHCQRRGGQRAWRVLTAPQTSTSAISRAIRWIRSGRAASCKRSLRKQLPNGGFAYANRYRSHRWKGCKRQAIPNDHCGPPFGVADSHRFVGYTRAEEPRLELGLQEPQMLIFWQNQAVFISVR